MRYLWSHGRLKWLLLATLGLGLGALTVGAFQWIEKSGFENSTVEAEKQTAELESQLNLLHETFWIQLEQIKQTALKVRKKSDPSDDIVLAPSDPILHWAEVEVANQQLKQIIATKQNPSWTPPKHAGESTVTSSWSGKTVENSFEQNYVNNVIKKIDFSQVKSDSTTLVRVRQDAQKRQPLLSIGFFVPGTKDQSQQLFIIALINPQDAFPIFERFGGMFPNGNRKAYLVAKDGQIVAHSQSSYSGASLKNTEAFGNSIYESFTPLANDSEKTNSSQQVFTNIDDLKVRLSHTKVRNLPLVLVVEQSANQTQGSSVETQNVVVGAVFSLVGILLVGFSISRFKFRRKKTPLISSNTLPELVPITNIPSPVSQAISQKQSSRAQIEALRQNIPLPSNRPSRNLPPKVKQTTPAAVPSFSESKEAIVATFARFETMAHQIRDSRITAAMLCQAASQITQSPTLYFTYQTQNRLMILENDWGFTPGREPVSMAFPLPLSAIKKIQECSQKNKLASLSNFEPLSSLILAREGVACFEAWAITTPVRSYQISPQVLGVLVILNSGIHSTQNRDFVVKMMKTVGTLYEGPTKSSPKVIPAQRSRLAKPASPPSRA